MIITTILAEGGFLSELAKLLTAIASLIVALIALMKFFTERRRRIIAEKRKVEAEERQLKAQALQGEELRQRLEAEKREDDEHKRRLEAEKRQEELKLELEQSLATLVELQSPEDDPMEENIVAAVKQLIAKVNQLTSAITRVRQDLDELKQRTDENSPLMVKIGQLEGGMKQVRQEVDQLKNPGKANGTGATGIPAISGTNGSYVLWLNPPFVQTPRFVHFSFSGTAFKIRDYLSGQMQFQPGGQQQREPGFNVYLECECNRDEVWQQANLWIPALDDLRKSVSDVEWWSNKLGEMTQNKDQYVRRSLKALTKV